MISCTDFIAAYSELFTYLDDHYGKEEVERFWTYLFEPTGKGIPLINFVKKDGLRGAWNYWTGTLTEEAADTLRYFNEEYGWMSSEMRYCPSKGRLLQLEKEIGLKPYYNYCGHCDYYRASLEAVGLRSIRIHTHVDEAQCAGVIYDPKKFKGICVIDENTEVLDIKPSEHTYFHRDFHSSLNMGVEYLGSQHGEQALTEYLQMYTRHVYVREIAAVSEDPFGVISGMIRGTYEKEQASDVLQIEQNEDSMTVRIEYCPAVKHLHETGRVVSDWFPFTTSVVMQTMAEAAGLSFCMERYEEQTGAAVYSFRRE